MNAVSKAGPAGPEALTSPAVPAGWRWPLAALGLGTLAWLALFFEEAAHAVSIWESSAAYNHGWLILPIAVWLAWTRRRRLPALRPVPTPAFALLGLPAAVLWLLAERMGVMEGRQFAALGLFYALVLATLGWRVSLAMAAPLAYLVFLVPFGAFTVPALQVITARMVDVMLDWTAIPHYVDDLLIEIPEGTFYIAEACAGLRFIIAALAFGALYAFVMFRSPWRRATVMALALAVPVLANGVRAFGLVVLGHWWGSAAAVDADHLIYGWGFFSVVILLLILAGLPFRQDGGPFPALSGPGAPGRPLMALPAALLALLAAAAGPAVAARLDAGAAATPPREVALPLPVPTFCEAGPQGALLCQGAAVQARLVLFAPRVNWDAVSAARRALTLAVSDQDRTFDVPLPGGGRMRARQAQGQAGTVAAAAWLDGRLAGDGVRARAAQALHALRGGHPGGPVLAVVELRPEGPPDSLRELALLTRVLEATGEELSRRAAALSLAR
ncbi:exosortase A [Roseococcus sp. DSY-14]|uniref:exosortase A n=1 Tax=Roseococcus sp. DSY-14 TaxID=3369650 RepID=UPI00387B3D49